MLSFKTILRNALEYSGTGDWIYTKGNLKWTSSADIVDQLPKFIRWFCTYVRTYNRLIGSRTVLLGHGLFRLAQFLDGNNVGPTQLLLGSRTTWLDLRDPGSLWAIQELSSGSDQTRLIAQLASEADLFVDVGANQGIFCAIANSVMSPAARIIAIEPQPNLADCIEATFAATPSRQSQVIRNVVTDLVGEVFISIPDENMGEAHIATGKSSSPSLRVQSTTLDILLGNIERGRRVLLKMDIEGAELAAMKGGRDFFMRCKPTLIMEINPDAMHRYGYTVQDAASFLQIIGYTSWSYVSSPSESNPIQGIPEMYCDIVLHSESST